MNETPTMIETPPVTRFETADAMLSSGAAGLLDITHVIRIAGGRRQYDRVDDAGRMCRLQALAAAGGRVKIVTRYIPWDTPVELIPLPKIGPDIERALTTVEYLTSADLALEVLTAADGYRWRAERDENYDVILARRTAGGVKVGRRIVPEETAYIVLGEPAAADLTGADLSEWALAEMRTWVRYERERIHRSQNDGG